MSDESTSDLFWASPRREERLLKFAALQVAVSEPRNPATAPGHLPVELRGYDPTRGVGVYGQIIKANLEPAKQLAAAAISAAAAALYQAILLQDNDRTAAIAHDLHADGISHHADNLIMRFNAACAFHLVGADTEAVRQFQIIADDIDDLTVDWAHNAVLSHRIRPLADMLPYGSLYTSIAEGKEDVAREIFAATARAYLGNNDAAVETYPDHPAAWRQLAKQRDEAEAGPDLVAQAFYRAVNLYPPVLSELLPIGLKAEEARDNPEAVRAILTTWILFVERTRDANGGHKYLTPDALEAAHARREMFSHWTGEILDRMIEPDTT